METVIKCEQIKVWNGKPIYGIGFSDGQGGESFKEIPLGTPMSEVTITPNPPYGNKVSLKNQASSGGGYQGGKKFGNESFALSYAKDLAIAYIEKGKDIAPDKVCAWADVFYTWLEKKKGSQNPSAPIVLASQLPPTSTTPAPVKPNDDLPF